MIIDLKTDHFPEGEFDCCVLGSGPAGITVSLKLAQHNKKVLLLEAGGLEYSEESRKLLECDSTGMEAWPQWKRQRFFGGTSNHWSGRCRPFESEDFGTKEFNGLPGWPIQFSQIQPYLDEAKKIVDIAEKDFEALNEDVLGEGFFPDKFTLSPPTRFAQKYYDEIKNSKDIICCVNANAVELTLDERKEKIKSVLVRNYSDKLFSFSGAIFVLAMGGIENARFLLNQDKQISSGIGNATGMVGKCFMEHLNVKLGEYIVKEEITNARYAFFTSDKLVAAENIGRSNVALRIVDSIKSSGRSAKIKTFFKNLACQISLEEKLQFIVDFECPGTGIITTLTEQEPGKHSYISIGSEKDVIGLRKAILHWELSENDLKTIRFLGQEFAKAFGDSGIGIVRLEDYVLDDQLEIPAHPHAHHMGTTRMASSPEHGVVDENCKVFGTNNLYIAGSSIFATGGASNPTMPLIQFALRLADHIAELNT